VPRREPPATADNCLVYTGGDERDNPVINQPLTGVTYTLRLSHADETIPLQMRAAADVQQAFWFIDNAFIGTSQPQATLAWRPQRAGRYQITTVDDHGRSAARQLLVEFVP
jgi:penicillin-binding protein 1C